MEKEILRLNQRKFWTILHDHFVEHYYITTKNQPPDYLIHNPVVAISIFMTNNNNNTFSEISGTFCPLQSQTVSNIIDKSVNQVDST